MIDRILVLLLLAFALVVFPSGAKADLQERATRLQKLIAAKASDGTVAAAARAVAAALIKAYPVTLAPAEPPDFARS